MKVYVVTAGEYSDYHIEQVFTDPDIAYAYANMDSDRHLEEYESDTVELEKPGIIARIEYDPKLNEITNFRTDGYIQGLALQNCEDKFKWGILSADRKLSARLLQDVQKHGTKSPLLLKIMQDAWTMYKAKHELEEPKEDEDEEVYIQVAPTDAVEMMKARVELYNVMFASTSSTMGVDLNEHDELR